ncbi:MAG TPA: DinB family protein [Candidatus Limnocylindrales bacterium]
MTDDKRDVTPATNLTPAQPITPRRRPPTLQMAQPIRRGEPQPAADSAEASDQQQELAMEGSADEQAPTIEGAPPGEAYSPVQSVIERVASAEVWSTSPVAPEDTDPAPAPAQAAPEVTIAADTSPTLTETAAPPAPELPKTMRDTLRSVDQAWAAFRAAAERFPLERMDERLSENGWTRKQMLEHVAAWHDLTADRVVDLINTGKPAPLDRDVDVFNAAVARRAIGKTAGEILKDMDATFNRLRRQMARLNDAQLRADDWWLAYVISANTYGHYGEHWAEIYTPELQPNGRARR